MKKWLSGWNLARLLRLLLGLLVLVNGLYTAQWVLAGLGLVFAAMALANAGCCVGSCTPPTRRSPNANEEIIYEEIK